MSRRTYVGIICNDHWDVKTLVLAEDAGAAREKVLANFSKSLGKTFREDELQIIAFGVNG